MFLVLVVWVSILQVVWSCGGVMYDFIVSLFIGLEDGFFFCSFFLSDEFEY